MTLRVKVVIVHHMLLRGVRLAATVQRRQQIFGSQGHQVKTKGSHVELLVSGVGIETRAVANLSLRMTTARKICLLQRLLGVPYNERCLPLMTTRMRIYHCRPCLIKLKRVYLQSTLIACLLTIRETTTTMMISPLVSVHL